MMADEKFDSLRKQIDSIDDRILALLNERARAVVELGRIKRAAGLKLYDPDREQSIFGRLTQSNSGPLPEEAVRRLFERVIDESRRLERTEVYDRD
jgi:chorismate mutase-like protein